MLLKPLTGPRAEPRFLTSYPQPVPPQQSVAATPEQLELRGLRAPKATPEQLDLLVQLVPLALLVPMVLLVLLAQPVLLDQLDQLEQLEQLELTAQMAAED
jgi:hypothetical protein